MGTTASPSPPAPDLAAVLALAGRGWRVFPCRSRDKTPLVREWQRVATTDEQQIRTWYEQHSGCNWGIATGRESGIWVLDVDGLKGEDSLKDLIGQYGQLSCGFTVCTGKGSHLYFACPATCEMRNSASRVGEGLDVRGEGGYVLAPGSIHLSCAVYAVVQNGDVTDAPDWLVKIAAASMQRQAREKEANTAGIISGITRGGRHKRLAHVIGRMQRDGMAAGAIEAAALAENATFLPPKPEAEVRKLVADMAKRYPACLPPHPGFELMPLNTLLAKGDTPTDYIWESHLVSGTVSAVVAKPKVGKSTFARNLCLAIARGEEFLGLPTRKGECIYLALEERENEVRADFVALGAAGTELLFTRRRAPRKVCSRWWSWSARISRAWSLSTRSFALPSSGMRKHTRRSMPPLAR